MIRDAGRGSNAVRAFQPAGADRVEIDAATLEAARCDAQQIDMTHGEIPMGAIPTMSRH
jgi:hypothetical protein